VEQQGTESINILPSGYDARSKVYEYGGGACIASPDGSLIFTDANTSGVFRLRGAEVQPIIDASPQFRYADFDVYPLNASLILAVQEDHSNDTPEAVENRIVLINSDDKSVEVVCQGADFYNAPRFSPDGTRISWMQWNHPDMPWTGSELYVGDWKDQTVQNAKSIAGKARVEGVGQPKWHEDGFLFFTSDRTGFSQLYRFQPSTKETVPLALKGWESADIAQNVPLFVLGT
jgi:Tol biopolymer transport system component